VPDHRDGTGIDTRKIRGTGDITEEVGPQRRAEAGKQREKREKKEQRVGRRKDTQPRSERKGGRERGGRCVGGDGLETEGERKREAHQHTQSKHSNQSVKKETARDRTPARRKSGEEREGTAPHKKQSAGPAPTKATQHMADSQPQQQKRQGIQRSRGCD
jgi:hypothetical protein